MEKVTYHETVQYVPKKRKRVSWGAIIGGTVTVLAVSILLGMIGMAIGLWAFDPTDEKTFSGVGTGMGIWGIISLLISLAAGGFVAGKLAGMDGLIHGFLTWSTTLIATVILMAMMLMGTVRFAGNVLGSVASATGTVISGVGSAVGSGASALGDEIEGIFGNIDFESDRDEMRQEMRQAMRNSGVREFQPEYIQQQLRAVRGDLQRSMKQLVANPKHADQVIDRFLQRTGDRADKAFGNVNREDVVKAVSRNTSLTPAQAEDTVNQYMQLMEQGRESIKELQQNIEQARRDWEVRKQEINEEMNKAANSAAWSMIWGFIALLVGAAVASFCGMFGARLSKEGVEA